MSCRHSASWAHVKARSLGALQRGTNLSLKISEQPYSPFEQFLLRARIWMAENSVVRTCCSMGMLDSNYVGTKLQYRNVFSFF